MEDSSENLDDGMLWLPSDIFPVEEVSVPFTPPKFKNSHPATSTCCCYSCNDHLSLMAEQQETDNENIIQRVAAFSLLHQRNHHLPHTHSFPKPFPISERFRPAERCRCTDCSLSGSVEQNRGGELLRTGGVYPYQFYTPHVESLIEARSRVLQMQENRFIRMPNLRINEDRFTGSRFFPFVGSGYGGGGSSTSGGTGVFLPRVPTNINDYRNHPHAGKRQVE